MKLIEIILFAAICFASGKCWADTNGAVLGPPRLFKEITNDIRLKTGEPNTIRILTNEPAWKMPILKYQHYNDAANYERVRITQTNEEPTVLILKQESSGTGLPSRPWKITLIDETNTLTISVPVLGEGPGPVIKIEWNQFSRPIFISSDLVTNFSDRKPIKFK